MAALSTPGDDIPGRPGYARGMRLVFLLAALLACCPPTVRAQDLTPYDNPARNFRIVPQRGWTLTETAMPGCTLGLEITKTPDCVLRICLSPPRQDILFSANAYVACENVKLYIADQLRGIAPTCFKGRVGAFAAYDTLYLRRVQAGDRVRVQLVNHLFAPLPGRLMQVMAYSLGDTEDEARAVFEANRPEIERMVGSVWMRGSGAEAR